MPRVKLFDENEVLEKAMNLFWKKGFYATSVQDLVNHLGINRASLYDTFGGKRELYDKAFSHYKNSIQDEMLSFLTSHSNTKEGFRALFQKSILNATKDQENKGCFVINSTVEMIPNEDDAIASISKNNNKLLDVMHKFILTGQDDGQISKDRDTRSLASTLFTFYNGLSITTKSKFNTEDQYKSIEIILSILD